MIRAHLLFRDRDLDWKWVQKAAAAQVARRGGWAYRDPQFDPWEELPWNAETLVRDLELGALFEAMAQGDEWVFESSRRTLLQAANADSETIRHRQGVLEDALRNPAVVRELYAVASDAHERQKGHYSSSFKSPESVLREAVRLSTSLLEPLRRLSALAYAHAEGFGSPGWSDFFRALREDLTPEYLDGLERELKHLRYQEEVLLMSAGLGEGGAGRDYVLHRAPFEGATWWVRLASLFGPRTSSYGFEIDPRDQAGINGLTDLRNRGVGLVAAALGRSVDHLRGFFSALRSELAFYVGCLNLRDRLAEAGKPICLPRFAPAEDRRLAFEGLYDVGLALTLGSRVVGNDANGDGKSLVVITGANTGGKSTFLRSFGVAQLMTQAGMFAPAEVFASSLCDGLFTHYKKEEDAGMESGKFDEELRRMSAIVDHLNGRSTLLLNESFAATNEREGSEVARGLLDALLERGVRVLCVTHLFELADGLYKGHAEDGLFLRAERLPDGTRSFRLKEGEPLRTSYAQDVYGRIFGQGSLAADP